MSAEDKYVDTMGRIPIAVILYFLELAFVAFIIIFIGQSTGIIKDEIIPPETLAALQSYLWLGSSSKAKPSPELEEL